MVIVITILLLYTNRNMDTCFVEWDEFSPESSLIPKMPPAGGVRSEFNPRKDIAESDAEM